MVYPSDLSDGQWSMLEMFFPEYPGHCRPRIHSFRSIINGILYVVRTGCQWRMLPKDYPCWQTVYDYYRKWRGNGKWDTINEVLRERVREAEGKKAIPSVAIIDSRSVKTAQKGGNEVTMRAKK
jgi:putative transposase